MPKTYRYLVLLIGSLAALATLAFCTSRSSFSQEREKRTCTAEEDILRMPFASSEAQVDLKAELDRLEAKRKRDSILPTFPPETPPGGNAMGWAMPDVKYWNAIPPEARQIPTDWQDLPVVRYTNTQLGGTREIRLKVGAVYDQWLLRDPLHDLTACISVARATHRVYFMEVAKDASGQWGYHSAFDNCYSCHASGPRVIRPLDEPGVDRKVLAEFNRRILNYHACGFGESVDPVIRGAAEDDARCTGCHDGVRRGKLYQVHERTIQFKTEREHTMPPVPSAKSADQGK